MALVVFTGGFISVPTWVDGSLSRLSGPGPTALLSPKARLGQGERPDLSLQAGEFPAWLGILSLSLSF